MEERVAVSLSVPARRWLPWAAVLAAFYLLVAFHFWYRTLIGSETWALYHAGLPFSEQIESVRGDLVHPPLIYLVERFWLATFGQTDTAAKSLPLIFVLPSIVLLTLLSTRVTPHWRLLSFFLASTYFHANNATIQVRMYGLAILLTYAGMLLWDNWRQQPRACTLAAWTAVMTLLIYTHLFGALVVSAFVVVNWLFGKRKVLFTAAAAIPAIAFLPWFLYVFPVYHTRGLGANLTWAHTNLASAFITVLYFFIGGIETETYRQHLLTVVLCAILQAIVVLIALANWKRFWPLRAESEPSQRWFWITGIFSMIPLLIVLVFSIVKTPALETRFVLGAMPAYWIAFFLLCQLSGRAGRAAVFVFLLPWVLAGMGTDWYGYRQPNWQRQDAEFVSKQVRPNDLLLAEEPDNANAIYWEWTRRLKLPGRIETIPSKTLSSTMMSILTPVELEKIDLTGVERVWLFCKFEFEKPRITEYLATRGYVLNEKATAGVPRLYLYERK